MEMMMMTLFGGYMVMSFFSFSQFDADSDPTRLASSYYCLYIRLRMQQQKIDSHFSLGFFIVRVLAEMTRVVSLSEEISFDFLSLF